MSESSIHLMSGRIKGGLWGALIGDALGVPVEFKSREEVQVEPVTCMKGFGTYNQPPGTWSDDGALLLCTVESLLQRDFDTEDMGRRFVDWMNEGHWSATGSVFDIGLATTEALERICQGISAERAGGRDEYSNGNGSLMRIIPVSLRFAKDLIEKYAERIERVSSITHGHERSKMACVFYSLVVRRLLFGESPQRAVESGREEFEEYYKGSPELGKFRRHLTDDFPSMPEGEIVSTGYVLHTLHASLWCLLSTKDYKECVLKAVNLGGDSDTTGCVAGGLAGVAYGLVSVPVEWRAKLPRQEELSRLLGDFSELCAASLPTTKEVKGTP